MNKPSKTSQQLLDSIRKTKESSEETTSPAPSEEKHLEKETPKTNQDTSKKESPQLITRRRVWPD